MFRLQRYFSIASGVAILIVTLAMSWAYRVKEYDDKVEGAQARNASLAQAFANTIWPEYAAHLSKPFTSGDALRADPATLRLHERLLAMSRGVPVIKIKIYNLEGVAVYSSVPAEIGENKSANPAFHEALGGKSVSELTHRGTMSITEGQVENVDVVSTYIPISAFFFNDTATTEIYTDVTDAIVAIARQTQRLVAGLVVVFGALYAALLLIVRRGDRILARQYRELARGEEQIRQVVESEQLSRLKRFFSPQLAERILAGGVEDPLRTHRREITAVHIDLRRFTAFTEAAQPEEVIEVLHRYHAAMGKLILEHEGTIEYFAGDGIMVIFNDPVLVGDAAERAVTMAIAMQSAFRPLAAEWRAAGYDLGMGIGIAQGYATIGAIGFEGRWDYGAIWPVTNLASRLCYEALDGQVLADLKVARRM